MKHKPNNKPMKIAVLVAHFFAAIFMLQAQNTSLPVGAIPGEIDVSPMGAATYTIPIEVVPGTQGMQPNLSIVYNSFSGMGLLGMKWSLAGLSAITRCGQTPYYDENITSIQVNSDDRFLLDGDRLIPISGNYGDVGTIYTSEMENFMRIVSNRGTNGFPDYFTAYTDDGTIIEYGNSEDSKQPLLFDLGDVYTTLNWYINKITDADGNYMTFHYGGSNGEIWIDEIRYTVNPNSTFTQPYAKVKFDYTIMPVTLGQNTYYVGKWEFEIAQTKLLETITVYYENTVVRTYQFKYNIDDPEEYTPHLKEVVLTGEDNTQLNATAIKWGDNDPKIIERTIDFQGHSSVLSGDFNGDGYSDLLVYYDLSNIKGWKLLFYDPSIYGFYEDVSAYESSLSHIARYAYDVDGDGRDELIIITPNGELKIFSLPSKTQIGATLNINTSAILFGDFDGNGTMDIAFTTIISNYSHKTIIKKIENGIITEMGAIEHGQKRVQVLNVNGNEKTDIKIGDTIYEFNGSSFQPIVQNYWSSGYCVFGDFNGDGISDGIKYSSAPGEWTVHISKGDGASDAYILDKNLLNTMWNHDGDPLCPILIADVNGDGKDDIVQTLVGNYPTTTLGFNILFSQGWVDGNYIFKKVEIIDDESTCWHDVAVGDFNADGKADLFASTGRPVNVSQGRIYYFVDYDYEFVKEIIDGIGKKIQMCYKHQYCLAESPNHQKDPCKKYFMSLIDIVKISNGINNDVNTWEYQYAIPKYSWLKKTFLGFQAWTSISNQENKKEDSWFSVNGTKDIMIPYSHKIYYNNICRHETTYNFSFVNVGNNRYVPYSDETTVKNFLTDTKTVTTKILSSAGRLTESNTKKYNACNTNTWLHSKTNTYSYETINLVGNQNKTVLTSIFTRQQYDNNNIVLTDILTFGYYTDNTNKGRLEWERKENSDGSIMTSYENYLPSGVWQLKTVSAQDCPMRSETFTYDATQRFVMSIKNILNHEMGFTYDAKTGNTKTETDPNGLTTTYKYDGFGNYTQIIYSDGTQTNRSVQWVSNSLLPNAKYSITTTSTGKPTVTVYYDILEREVFRLNDKYYYETQYNNLGQVTKTSYPFSNLKENRTWNSYTYDAFGRKETETAPYTDLSYNYSNRIVTITDNLRHISTSKNYDALRRIIQATDAGGAITYNYAVIEEKKIPRHLTTISAVGATTEIITDLWGNRLSITDPDAGEIISTYTKFNELETQIDANGNTTSYQYDQLGRVTQKKFTATDYTTQTIDYVYDYLNYFDNLKGKLYQINMNGAKSESFSYDEFGRLWFYNKVIDNRNYGFYYEYTPAGQLQTLTYPDGFAVNYTYTSVGKLNEIRRSDDNSNSLIYKVHTRNKYNQPTKCEYGNGVVTEYDYNPYGLLTRINTGKKNHSIFNGGGEARGISPEQNYWVDSTILNYRYKYNDKGLMSSRSEGIINRLETYTYDYLDRLTSIVSGTMRKPPQPPQPLNLFSYSPNGNITYNPNVGSYIYDGNKPHAVTKITPLDENVISANQCDITYNYFNQPTKITEGENELNLFYDANQQRNKTLLGVNSPHYYINKYYEEEQIYVRPPKYCYYHYIYGDNGVVALYIISDKNPTDSMYYIHTDHLGSYCAVTNANKQVVLRNHFDPWGNYVVRDFKPYFNGEQPLTARGFTGHEHYPYFKIINMNGRLYDPVIGRFFSPDNFVQSPFSTQGYNRYSYALNNPLRYKDPTGQWYEDYDDYDDRWDDDYGRPGGGRGGRGGYDCPDGTSHVHQDDDIDLFGNPSNKDPGDYKDDPFGYEDWMDFDYNNPDGPDDDATYPSHPYTPGGGSGTFGTPGTLHPAHAAIQAYVNAMFPNRLPKGGIPVYFGLWNQSYGETDRKTVTYDRITVLYVSIPEQYWNNRGTDNRMLIDVIDHELVHIADYVSGRALKYYKKYATDPKVYNIVENILDYRAYQENQWYNEHKREPNKRYDYSDRLESLAKKLPVGWWNIK